MIFQEDWTQLLPCERLNPNKAGLFESSFSWEGGFKMLKDVKSHKKNQKKQSFTLSLEDTLGETSHLRVNKWSWWFLFNDTYAGFFK